MSHVNYVSVHNRRNRASRVPCAPLTGRALFVNGFLRLRNDVARLSLRKSGGGVLKRNGPTQTVDKLLRRQVLGSPLKQCVEHARSLGLSNHYHSSVNVSHYLGEHIYHQPAASAAS